MESGFPQFQLLCGGGAGSRGRLTLSRTLQNVEPQWGGGIRGSHPPPAAGRRVGAAQDFLPLPSRSPHGFGGSGTERGRDGASHDLFFVLWPLC